MHPRKLVDPTKNVWSLTVGYQFSGRGNAPTPVIAPMRGYIPNVVDMGAIERETKAARELMEQMK